MVKILKRGLCLKIPVETYNRLKQTCESKNVTMGQFATKALLDALQATQRELLDRDQLSGDPVEAL